MSQTQFLALPVLDDQQIQSILLAYSLQFDRWPQALLPGCVTDRIIGEAKDALERLREAGKLETADEQTYEDQLALCRTEKPMLRTAWGYLTGERAPRWHEGTLSLMNMIAISSFAAMPPAMERGMQKALTDALGKIVRDHPGVMVIPGSEGELCRLACSSVWEDETDTDLSPCRQMINVAYALFDRERLHNLIHHAAALASSTGQNVLQRGIHAPASIHFH